MPGSLKCYLPFQQATVVESGAVYPCICPSWLKGDGLVGNTQSDRLQDIWNGEAYQRIRALFLDGRYDELCRTEICPYLRGEEVAPAPDAQVLAAVEARQTVLDYGIKALQHDIDRGCNLNCTMCRDDKIAPDAENVALGLRDVNDAIELGSLDTVTWSGAGEAIAMAQVVREMESDRFSSRGIELTIITNLTGFNEKLWARIGHNAIRLVVSADGCSPEVYEPIRVGARWSTVLENMRTVGRLRQEGRIRDVMWNYTVMRENIRDVSKAIALAEELGLDHIRINAQLGSLSRTNGNMFEDLDLEALDSLYDELDRSGAFEKPFVLVSTTGMRERRYRTLAYRLEMAEHIYGRRHQADTDPSLVLWLQGQVLRVIEQTVADVRAGTIRMDQPVPPASISFLRGLTEPGQADWMPSWRRPLAKGLLLVDYGNLQALRREARILRDAAMLLESLTQATDARQTA